MAMPSESSGCKCSRTWLEAPRSGGNGCRSTTIAVAQLQLQSGGTAARSSSSCKTMHVMLIEPHPRRNNDGRSPAHPAQHRRRIQRDSAASLRRNRIRRNIAMTMHSARCRPHPGPADAAVPPPRAQPASLRNIRVGAVVRYRQHHCQRQARGRDGEIRARGREGGREIEIGEGRKGDRGRETETDRQTDR